MRIDVTNVREGDTLPHPLVLLEGVVTSDSGGGCSKPLELEARVDVTRSCVWPVAARSGAFKALVLLPAPGAFALSLRLRDPHDSPHVAPRCERVFNVAYAPPPATRMVRFYYQRSADAVDTDSGGFDAPPGVDNSDTAALARIRLNALLLQTATAEMLCAAGMPRSTFVVELASDGLPLVRVLRSSFSNAAARAMPDQELIRRVHDDIVAQGLDAPHLKHAVILGCSTFNAATQRAEGHTALGGDRVGVFGSCGLHTWPQQLGEITAAWLDNRKIDTRALLDDSCYRGTHWANYATGLGAVLHELGHTFGLGHAETGIMGRGFDDMNRLFSVYEVDPHDGQPGFHPPHAADGRVHVNLAAAREVAGPGGAHWDAGSARMLRHCPWLSGVPRQSTRAPSVSWVHDICGPVGHGQYDGQQIAFESGARREDEHDLGAVFVDCGSFLNRLQTFSRAEVARWDSSKWRAGGHTHLFVLADGEFVTRVDVRAMAFVDGVQLHTNRRSSRWFGGFGGVLEVLQPQHGCKIHSFFGTRGNNYIGTIGARCSPIVPGIDGGFSFDAASNYAAYAHASLSAPPFPSPTIAGLALSDGEQLRFTTPLALTLCPQAIVVKCDSFVEAVRVLSREDHAAAVREQNRPTFAPHEHVFELTGGERLVRVEVRSGHWVDSVRFATNLRVSPWFGGAGGTDTTVMEAPTGHQVCGLFGTRGDHFVGSLGALFCPEQAPLPPPNNQDGLSGGYGQQTPHTGAFPEHFSIMQPPETPPFAVSSAGCNPALGIIVALQDGHVTFVQSFDSAQAFDGLLSRVYSTSPFDLVQCFPLTRDDQLVQVDVSFCVSSAVGGPSMPVVDGICFHTSTRCSSWLGGFHGDALRFFTAPEGRSICELSGVFTDSTLTDIVGRHSPSSQYQYHHQQQQQEFAPDDRVQVNSFNGFDVRLESRSEFGLESVHLLKKNGGDHLSCHAWDWLQFHPASPHPRRWFIPGRLLLDKIPSQNRGSTTASELLFSEYIVGALDCGGGFGSAAGPPSWHE